MLWQVFLALVLGVSRASLSSNLRSSAAAENPLASLDPVQVGYTRWINLGGGRSTEVQTLALSPPLFLIKGLLSSEESLSLIDEARALHTKGSTMGGTTPQQASLSLRKTHDSMSYVEFYKMFRGFDRDRDGALDKKELEKFLRKVIDLPNHDHDLFMKRYNFTSPLGMNMLFGLDLVEYRKWVMKNHPHLMQRFSDQVWLSYGTNKTQSLVDRAAKITGLPKEIISGESKLQVLHYGKRGHYSCHYDSPPSHIPDGRIVRLGTMAVFLNEPESGGQIAFPGADKTGSEKWKVSDWADLKSQCQATDRCTSLGGVVVTPKKGDAVLWYNMKTDHWSTDGKGDIKYHSTGNKDDSFNWSSLHCGAEVSKGEKWMANIWFRGTSNQASKTAPVTSTIDAPSTILV